MTVLVEDSRMPAYIGNGATVIFPYTFKIFTAADLVVTQVSVAGVETLLTLNVDYTVDGVLNASGGNVTLLVALPGTGVDDESQKLTIRRVIAETQPLDLKNQGKLTAELLERAYDRVTMLVQQISDEAQRSLRLPESETGAALTTILPKLADRKGRSFYFDDAGQPAAGSSILGTTVSAVMEAVVAAATRQAAIDLLAGGVTANRVLLGDGTHISLGQIDLSTAIITGKLPLSSLLLTPLTLGTIDTATIGRVHTFANPTLNGTCTLPTAVGNAGLPITILVKANSVKRLTVDADGDETIDDVASLTMLRGGKLTVVSDGANWYSTLRDLAPGFYISVQSSAGQVVTGTSEDVNFEVDVANPYSAWVGTFTAPVSGLYTIHARTQGNADAYPMIYLDGSLRVNGINSYGGGTSRGSVHATLALAAGVVVTIRMSNTITLTTTATDNTLRIARVGEYA